MIPYALPIDENLSVVLFLLPVCLLLAAADDGHHWWHAIPSPLNAGGVLL